MQFKLKMCEVFQIKKTTFVNLKKICKIIIRSFDIFKSLKLYWKVSLTKTATCLTIKANRELWHQKKLIHYVLRLSRSFLHFPVLVKKSIDIIFNTNTFFIFVCFLSLLVADDDRHKFHGDGVWERENKKWEKK